MSKKDQIIKTITIQIAGTEVEVTPQQAKNLHEALGELLGIQPQVVEKTVYRDNWYPYWRWPTDTWYSTGTITAVPADNYRVTFTGVTGSATLSIGS